MDWRNIWINISFIILLLPIVSYFLIQKIKLGSREIDKNNKINIKIKNWKRVEVIKDYRFYIVCANMLAMPWIATGIFVYQSFILSSKNWGPYVIAQSFMVYSILSVITLFIAGYLIDKFSSRKLLIYMNLPFLLSLILITVFDDPVISFLFLGLIGISNGLANVLGSSTWAEVYGVKHIGSIKALTTSLMVFSTAFGTAVFGLLIDNGFSIEEISIISGTYVFLALIALLFVTNKLNPIKI
tara:strand:- start:1455 stop:2180 length:726 start_codon:yes stop_codon:yes gene_type:complete